MTVKNTPMGLISTEAPKERASGFAPIAKDYTVRREELAPADAAIYNTMYELARSEVEALEISGRRGKIRLWHHGPLSWFQVKDLSKRLTAEFDVPILVLPRTKYGDEITEEPEEDEYRQFEAHVVLVRTENDKRASFEMATCYERGHKDKDTGEYHHDAFVLGFPGEAPYKSFYKPELSFPMENHVYAMQHKKCNFTGYSRTPLDLGQVYRIGGLMFRASDKKNTKATPFQDRYCIIDWAVPVRNTVEINQQFLDKFKGLTHDQIRDSVAFPFEQSMKDYKEVPFISIFYIKSKSEIPFNVFLVGSPGTTKSAFMQRIAAISGDVFVDGGSATLKGIMPSFNPKAQQVGVLGASRYFALVDEFLHIVKGGDKAEAPYNVLNTLKKLLEGQPTYVPSGIGSMTVKMRSSTFFASNWIELGRGGKLASINDFYGRFDAALLDRFFLYPVRSKTQRKMIDQHSETVKDEIKRFEAETGAESMIEALEKMPTPYPLNTYDLRTILLFKEQIVARMDKEAMCHVRDAIRMLRLRMGHSYERYTRASDHLTNISSAYAFERMLIAGQIKPDTAEITITKEDAAKASEFMELVYKFYDGRVEDEKTVRKEFYQVSATPPQRFVIDVLREAYETGDSTGRYSVPADLVYDKFMQRYLKPEWEMHILPLIGDRIILYDGMDFMWLPDLLEDDYVRSLFVGNGEPGFKSAELHRLHLIGSDLKSRWLPSLPLQPTDEVKTRVGELCAQAWAKAEDLKTMAGLDGSVVENALLWLHLQGELWHTQNGYLKRPVNNSK